MTWVSRSLMLDASNPHPETLSAHLLLFSGWKLQEKVKMYNKMFCTATVSQQCRAAYSNLQRCRTNSLSFHWGRQQANQSTRINQGRNGLCSQLCFRGHNKSFVSSPRISLEDLGMFLEESKKLSAVWFSSFNYHHVQSSLKRISV